MMTCNEGNIYFQRIEAVRKIMRTKGLDAVVISGSDPHASEYPALRWKQVEWISGFTGEAGDIVITLDHAGLWTDTRYFIQAVEQLQGTGVELHKTRIPGEVRIPEWLAEVAFVDKRGPVIVALDGLSWNVSSVEMIKTAFKRAGRRHDESAELENGYKIVDMPDMLDQLWDDRPAVPVSPIITLGDDLTGESRQSKIASIRRFLEEVDCDSILFTALDEIAWTLNVRGSDVEYNPVVISYLLVTNDDVCWFVKKPVVGKLDSETLSSFAELEADGVMIRPYDDVELVFSGADCTELRHLYVDPATLNWHLYKAMASSSVKVKAGVSPIPLKKAVKNEIEISGMREAHLEDGLAMEKFLFWLETEMASGAEIDEWDAAVKLDSLRAQIPGYRGNSFETISAYGPSAALPHYVTHEVGSRKLEPRGLYLCDSGGQYLFGTTDITRTVPLGPCTDLEKEDYTLVLKGHIGLATAMFPAGTSGSQIDYAARSPLWKFKRDFGHGTGHGVGFFLNVHEGPQEIRHNFNSQPLLPGMISSDEPGLYREGMHGIRHENLLLCTDAGTNEFGSWRCFENLTLCHIDTAPVITDLLTDEEMAWLNAYNAEVYATLAPHLPEDVAEWLKTKTLPISE